MRAMLFCAGLGTRLRPLTDLLPKPAFPVHGVPLCWYDLALLAGVGVREVIANTHYLPDEMARCLRAGGSQLGLDVEVSHEPTLLGTGGGLAKVASKLRGDTFLLLNGDILFDVDLAAALAAHRRAGPAATMVVRAFPEGAPFRPVHVAADGRVVRIAGEGSAPPGTTPWLFTGVHVLEPRIFDGIPQGPCGLHEEGYGPLLRAGAPVIAHRDEGAWYDIGTPARYLEANLSIMRGEFPLTRFQALRRLPHVPGEEPQIDGLVEVAVVGARAVVPAGAVVCRSVIWDDTKIGPTEHLDRCIAAGPLRVQA